MASGADVASLGLPVGDALFLGIGNDQVAHFALSITDHLARAMPGAIGFLRPAVDLRSLAMQGALTREELSLAGQARALAQWHENARCCGRCGSTLLVKDGGWRKKCWGCGLDWFPRIDPVVIMLITDGERCILAHEHRYVEKMYSTLAGFLEPGEDIEHAVRREVFEETAIKVGRVVYHSSQPWPFPHSLMLGCIGYAENTDIQVDLNELAEARWFGRDEARSMLDGTHPQGLTAPRPHAIAHALVALLRRRQASLLLEAPHEAPYHLLQRGLQAPRRPISPGGHCRWRQACRHRALPRLHRRKGSLPSRQCARSERGRLRRSYLRLQGLGHERRAVGAASPRTAASPMRRLRSPFSACSPRSTRVDLGIYGTSYGGATVVWTGAVDQRVKCIVSAVGVGDGRRWMRSVRRPDEWRDLLQRSKADREKRVLDGKSAPVERSEILFADRQSAELAAAARRNNPAAINTLPLEYIDETLEFNAEWVVDKIAPRPILFITTDDDRLVPPEESQALYARAGEPKRLVTLKGFGHYEVYVEPAFSQVMTETLAWFRQYLPPR